MIWPILKTMKTTIGTKRFTVNFPEERESMPDNYRGMLRLDMNTCISC